MADRTEAEIRDAALEEAALFLESHFKGCTLDMVPIDHCYSLIQSIRALKSAPAADAGRTDVRRAQPKRRPYNASASLSEYGISPECDAAQAPAKGADVALPPLPDLQFKMFYRSDVLAELEAYARAAVLADRQQRKPWPMEEQPDGTVTPVDPIDRQQRGGDCVIVECWKVLHEAGLDRRHFDGPLPDAIRAALAAQPAAADLDAAHARGYREGVKAEKEFAAGQPAASAEPEQYKTDDELGGVLAAIRHYGGQKWAEGRGVADDDLQNVRNAWAAVYERVQALAAHKPEGGDALRRLVDEKFSSGNAIPVERITITRQEYAAIAQQHKEGA